MNDFERHLTTGVDDATPADPPPYANVLSARDRRRTRRRTLGASAGAVALVTAIVGGSSALLGDGPSAGPSVASPSASPSASQELSTPVVSPDSSIPDVPPEWDGESAPPIVLQLDGEEVLLEPWTSCFTGEPDESGISSGGCFDGMPQPPFVDVGDRGEVPFSFPLKGWTFEATFSPLPGNRDACWRTFTVPAEKTGDYTLSVPPAGPAGRYQVDVFGRGPQGDVITSFAWTTAETGFLPKPTGYVGLVSDDDDDFIAYPLELALNDLGTTPGNATVTVTVTADDGAERTIGPLRAQRGCNGAGSVFFQQEDGAGGGEPLDLGPAPFRYRAEVTLDGETYVGTALWPRDERADEAPYTDLVFDPPLPAFEG